MEGFVFSFGISLFGANLIVLEYNEIHSEGELFGAKRKKTILPRNSSTDTFNCSFSVGRKVRIRAVPGQAVPGGRVLVLAVPGVTSRQVTL